MCTLCIANWVMEFHSKRGNVKWLEWECEWRDCEWKRVRKQHYGKKLHSLSFPHCPIAVLWVKAFGWVYFYSSMHVCHYDDESTLNVDFPQYSQYTRTEWVSVRWIYLDVIYTCISRDRNFNLLQCNEWHFIMSQSCEAFSSIKKLLLSFHDNN